jgi:amidase
MDNPRASVVAREVSRGRSAINRAAAQKRGYGGKGAMSLIDTSAVELARMLETGVVAPGDLLDALAARIAAVEPAVNALPTLCLDRARTRARHAQAKGPLHGLPVAVKDLSAVAGVRTTWGSPIHADTVPVASDHVAERIEASGGLIHAKTNTPEFGAGAQTFNAVFGITRNPWNTALTPAGSSGGSAVALKTGTAWLAHGSDLGGSLRNPASFCGIVGLRPSVGRVPSGPGADPYASLSVEGPMARTVADVALFLDALSGEDGREPLSLPAPSAPFLAAAQAPRMPRRVAVSRDLGITPVDPEVAALVEAAARRCESLGAVVEEAHPDLREAHACFQTLRALGFATAHGPALADRRDLMKPDVVWNVEKGLALTGAEIGAALRARGVLMGRMRAFFRSYDLLLCPATIVPPFPVEQRYVEECAGVRFETYVDWLAIAYAVTLTGHPALSLPCGFTAAGLPVGLQMVGPWRGEAALLSAAAALEAELALDPRPIDPRPPA